MFDVCLSCCFRSLSRPFWSEELDDGRVRADKRKGWLDTNERLGRGEKRTGKPDCRRSRRRCIWDFQSDEGVRTANGRKRRGRQEGGQWEKGGVGIDLDHCSVEPCRLKQEMKRTRARGRRDGCFGNPIVRNRKWQHAVTGCEAREPVACSVHAGHLPSGVLMSAGRRCRQVSSLVQPLHQKLSGHWHTGHGGFEMISVGCQWGEFLPASEARGKAMKRRATRVPEGPFGHSGVEGLGKDRKGHGRAGSEF